MASASSSSKSKRSKKADVSEWGESNSENDSKTSAKDAARGKRMKTDESGIDVVQESDLSDLSSENVGEVPHTDELNDSTRDHSDKSDRDSGNPGSPQSSSPAQIDQALGSEIDEAAQYALDMSSMRAEAEMIHTSEDNSDAEIEGVAPIKDVLKKFDPTPNTPLPKHSWSATNVFTSRQYGYSSKYSPDLFRYNCYGSLHMVERLELMYKMKKHEGCVNALNYNSTGTKLVSGSDDLNVIIWDWTVAEPLLEYRSGHNTNVFQAKFLPLCNDCYIVTCARDGQVRLGEISTDGSCRGTRKLAQHKGSVHKLSIQMDSPHNFMTCGEDAVIFSIDLREEKPTKILNCKHNGNKVALYSVFTNPQKSHEFVVSGRNQYVKIYDSRYLPDSEASLREFCPDHLADSDKFNVTCAVYNYNGQEIIASYNDEDIYLFDAQETDSTKYLHRYRGHRNSQTVKGVHYFGSKSEFIVSGSDCGYIFFWEKESEHIVKYMYGDEGGAVNCLEPHPTMPVLATSGLDDDIKIWVPSCENPPDMTNLKSHLIQNMKGREEDTREGPDAFVDQTIWFLMQHLSRARQRVDDGGNDSSDSSTTSSDEMYDATVSPSQCNQS